MRNKGSRENLIDLVTHLLLPPKNIACLLALDCTHMTLKMKEDGGKLAEISKERKEHKVRNEGFFCVVKLVKNQY